MQAGKARCNDDERLFREVKNHLCRKVSMIVSGYKIVLSSQRSCCCCSTWDNGSATSWIPVIGDDWTTRVQGIKVPYSFQYYISSQVALCTSLACAPGFAPPCICGGPTTLIPMHKSALHTALSQACTAIITQPGKDPACPYGGPRETAPCPAWMAPAFPDRELAIKDARSPASTDDPMYSLAPDASPKPNPPVVLPVTTVVTSAEELSTPGNPWVVLTPGMLPAPEVVGVLLPATPLSAMPGKPGMAVTLAGGAGVVEAVLSASGLGGGGLPPEGGLGDAKHAPVSSWHCVPTGQGPALYRNYFGDKTDTARSQGNM